MIFHTKLGFPNDVDRFIGKTFTLTFSNHAKRACKSDRYGIILPPSSVTVTKDNLIEAEVDFGKVTKLLIRQSHDEIHDISIAFIPEPFLSGYVKTLWLNKTSDNHRTLDESKYDRP